MPKRLKPTTGVFRGTAGQWTKVMAQLGCAEPGGPGEMGRTASSDPIATPAQVRLSDNKGLTPSASERELAKLGAPAKPHRLSSPRLIQDLIRDGILAPPRAADAVARLDRYDLIRFVAEGGMGLILLAREIRSAGPSGSPSANPETKVGQSGDHSGLERTASGNSPGNPAPIAIKLLKPRLIHDARAVRLFLNEARYLQQLDHPNILKILAISVRPDRPYFVMPYLPRGSLAEAIPASGSFLDAHAVWKISHQIASALDDAHKNSIIHGDLKPANVLLDEYGNAYLTDFGLARSMPNESQFQADRPVCEGTVAYMSPAVVRGEAEDTRRDIYSFGAVLYQMLTGQAPYSGESNEAIQRAILAGPPRPITEINPQADPGLARIAETAMARERRDRYADMGDLLADLRRIQRGQIPAPSRAAGGASAVNVSSPRTIGRKLKLLMAASLLVSIIGTVFWKEWTAHQQKGLPSGATGSVRGNFGLQLVRKFPFPHLWRWSEALMGEWEGDREPELFFIESERLLVVSGDGKMLHDLPLTNAKEEAFQLDWVRDIDGDKRDEFFFSWRQGTNLTLAVLNQNLLELKRFQALGVANLKGVVAHYASKIRPALLKDLDRDGKRELLAVVWTGYELRPRALKCYDFESQRLLWEYPTASPIGMIESIDLDRDGKEEILMSLGAPGNGSRLEDGTEDSRSWFFALTSEGKLIWKHELAGLYSYGRPLIADLDGDGQPECLVTITTLTGYSDEVDRHPVNQVRRYNREGNEIARFDLDAMLLSTLVVDLESDGFSEILCTDNEGFLYELDQNLKLKRKVRVSPKIHDQVYLMLLAIHDLDLDGKVELLLIRSQTQFTSKRYEGRAEEPPTTNVEHDNAVIVLNSSLQPVARYTVAEKWKRPQIFKVVVTDLNADGRADILSLTDEANVLEFKP